MCESMRKYIKWNKEYWEYLKEKGLEKEYQKWRDEKGYSKKDE